jgi:RNA polymerase sigma factor (sigma-70 family)
MASGPVWAASLRAARRRAKAEELFSEIMRRLHADRFALPERLSASALPNASLFLEREIETHIDAWLIDQFRLGAADAGEVLVRIFHSTVKSWVQRAAPPGERSGSEDRVQDVFAALLADGGRRIMAYAGGGSFRAYLRRVVVNLAMDSARHEAGRFRPGKTPGAPVGMPRLVSLDDETRLLDPPDEGANPEAELLAIEDWMAQTEREATVISLLRGLAPEQRKILEARFLEGRKPRDIAALMGRDIKDVYRTLERTLAQLKKALV